MNAPTLKEATKILAGAYSGENDNQTEIDCDLENIAGEIELLGADIYFLDTALCPDTYGLSNNWATVPCIIGESGGNSTRTVVYL